MLTLEMLQKLWPHRNVTVAGLIEGMAKTAPTVFPKYELDSDLTIAHFMAQASEETGAGLDMQENMNYTAVRLLQVFPTHFTRAQAIELQHQPRLIADRAYGGRMGNAPPPSDDGWNFRGKGLSQVTGKNGYIALAKKSGLDVINHPDLLIQPDTALECGVADFVLCGCLPYAKRNDVVGVSAMLNVGHYTSNVNLINGYSERVHWLGLWKHVMGL
jgi:putative chitinase